MSEENKTKEETKEKTKEEKNQEELELVIRNNALQNLKSLAKQFDVPETELKEIVAKAIKLLSITKDSKFLIMEDKEGNRYKIDINNI